MEDIVERSQQKERDIDYISILRDVVRRWPLLVLVAIAAFVVSYIVVTETYTPKYTATATFVVSSKSANTTVFSNLTAAEEMAEVFAGVLDSDTMRKAVAEDLGISKVTSEIATEVIPETNILELSVTDPSARTAFLVIQSLMEQYGSVTNEFMSNAIFEVLASPTVPSSPDVSMERSKKVGRSVLIALIVAIVLLAFRSYLSDTVKNEEYASEHLSGTLLATLYHENTHKGFRFKGTHKSILISNPITGFGYVETVKKLRTRLEYRFRTKGYKVLMVTSVLENEGKSTVSANIALSLAQKGKRVALIDADLRKPAIAKIFGLNMKNRKDLVAYLDGGCSLRDIVQVADNVRLLTAATGEKDASDLVNSSAMKGLIETLAKQADYVIIDTPPMTVAADAEALAEFVDASLLVVRQGYAHCSMINDFIDVLGHGHSDYLGCVFNNVYSGFNVGGNDYGYGGRGYGGYGYGRYGYGRYGYGNYGRYGYGHYGQYGKKSKKSNYYQEAAENVSDERYEENRSNR
ncbi:MAG: polysaccharide biosynthesis tyrosine autokinase [Bacillota bacterium]|nr:polysaccharide biosynthesis tyrosine autokinase [Bacillota bacterium]